LIIVDDFLTYPTRAVESAQFLADRGFAGMWTQRADFPLLSPAIDLESGNIKIYCPYRPSALPISRE